MFWAGKKSLKTFFKGLFSRERALSSPKFPTVDPLTGAQRERLQAQLDEWVARKAYRLPDRTLQETAAHIGTYPLLLHRFFAEKGLDFRSWRAELRIRDAKEMLLQEPDTPASTIGTRVGIPDRSNFNRQFKAIVGIPPDLWRNNR